MILQVGTLQELQRLYDQLIEKAEDCRLDKYASSDKAGRYTPTEFPPFELMICNLKLAKCTFDQERDCFCCIVLIHHITLVNLQEQMVMVSSHATVNICPRQRIISLWGSWDRQNYVNGPVLRPVVSIKLILLLDEMIHLATCRYLYLHLYENQKKCFILIYGFYVRPASWRKKRIHFHDFMLNVHSRLQVCT